MARKRAPGGGRKPSPHTPRAQLTVRMPDDLRAQLEAAAQKRKRTLSDELLARLSSSFARERQQEHDRVTRALAHLISMTAEAVHLHQLREWHLNRFLFRAFKLAVAKVLDALEPSGEIQFTYPITAMAPELLESVLEYRKTPEGVAQFAAQTTLQNLFSLGLRGPEDHRREINALISQHPPDEAEFMKGLVDDLMRDYYDMSHVRRDLGIKLKEPKQ